MAAGKAIIAGTGLPQTMCPLENGRSAVLTEPRSEDALHRAILRLVEDPDRVDLLGAEAHKIAAETMDYPVVAATYRGLLAEIVTACTFR